MWWRKARTVGDNETFVGLIRAAEEDAAFRTQLLRLLSADSFNRRSALNTCIEQMRLKGAPGEFISAMACLLDDKVVEQAKAILLRGGR